MNNRPNINYHLLESGVSDIHITNIKEVTGERTNLKDSLLWEKDEKAKPAARRGRKADRVPTGDGRAAIRSIELRRTYHTLLMEVFRMKKLLVFLIAVTMVAGFSTLSFADGLGTGIATDHSPHNFVDNWSPEVGAAVSEVGGGGWNGRGEICRVCHIPHDNERSDSTYAAGLLWNHELSTVTYTMYDNTWSPTIDGSVDSAPTGATKLCLSCHDGSVALDSFDKYAGSPTTNKIQSIYSGQIAGFKIPANNGTLAGTHPVSIVYDDAADTGLRNPASTTIGSSGDVIDDVLEDGKVQCSSCHDVHDQDAVGGTHLLRVANGSGNPSGLCLTCHDK